MGCDGAWDFTIPVGVLFQSTHPSGVRHDPAWRCRDCWRISIHAPQWGATQRPDRHQRRFPISIHAPQWGATIGLLAGGFLVEISIHAPQWGATRAILSFLVVQEISIHAPQWGATLPLRPRAGQTSNFNPRTPVGCDSRSPFRRACIPISIHAPQWGATLPQYWHGSVVIFQSTHPSGVRLISMPQYLRLPNFNPRTPVGCDALMIGPICSRKISIHAPQWGATTIPDARFSRRKFQSTHPSGVRRGSSALDRLAIMISIHAPQWGATTFAITVITQYSISIHAPQWGATITGQQSLCLVDISIHAPQWGATLSAIAQRAEGKHFNPRTPVGCDVSTTPVMRSR